MPWSRVAIGAATSMGLHMFIPTGISMIFQPIDRENDPTSHAARHFFEGLGQAGGCDLESEREITRS